MANLYVTSTGSNTPPYDTWAKAATTPATAVNAAAAGDTVYINAESYTISADTTWALAGSITAPVRVICSNDKANEPPTVVASKGAATYTHASSWDFTINGIGYIYGFGFTNTVSTASAVLLQLATADNNYIILDSFTHSVTSTSAATFVGVGVSTELNAGVKLINSSFNFTGNSTHKFNLYAPLEIVGGSITTATALTQVFVAAGRNPDLSVSDCDLAGLGSSTLINAGNQIVKIDANFVNCKLNASTTLVSSFSGVNQAFVQFTNCSSSSANYLSYRYNLYGTLLTETTLVKTGGASDGTTSISWKLTTTANANESFPFTTGSMAVWIDTTGASKTITVDILHDSATALTDAEIWLEIDYLGSSATPLGTPLSDKRATVLTTAANQPTSTASWTTTGLTTPNKQKLEVTFTPQMKGFVYARVCLAKPSYTVYVDPQAILS
jgi:hypothetical protein